MAETFRITQNDTAPSLAATLMDGESPVNLTGKTVAFVMRQLLVAGLEPEYGAEVKVNAAAVVTNAAGGVVRYDWAVGDTDAPGDFRGEFKVTDGDGKVATYPDKAHIAVTVARSLAA